MTAIGAARLRFVRPTLGSLCSFLAVLTGGFLLLANASVLTDLVVACITIGAGQGGTSGPRMALLAHHTPNQRMGRAMGTNNVLGDVGGGPGLLAIAYQQTGSLNPATAAAVTDYGRGHGHGATKNYIAGVTRHELSPRSE